jgi:hypothetical protein
VHIILAAFWSHLGITGRFLRRLLGLERARIAAIVLFVSATVLFVSATVLFVSATVLSISARMRLVEGSEEGGSVEELLRLEGMISKGLVVRGLCRGQEVKNIII